jgi:hypothetical protein
MLARVITAGHRRGADRACRSALLVLVAAVLLGLAPSAAAEPAGVVDGAGLPPELAALYFPATGHNLTGGFLRYWWERGQVALFGHPISEEQSEDGRTVQYFERARFEYYPEHRGTPHEVQLGLLGREVTRGRDEPAFRPVGPVAESAERAYAAATGHTVAFAFKRFWEAAGGLRAFGYPISEEFQEEGRTVQYFERARFEYRPEAAGTPDEVQLGRLGRQVARARGLTDVAASPRAGATVWDDRLPLEMAARRRAAQQQAALNAVPEAVAPFQAVVTVPQTELRRAPTVIAARVDFAYARHIVHVVGVAAGEPIAGDARWYQLAAGDVYLPAAHVAPFTPPPPPRTWPGRWIDVNLTDFYATGYEGDRPLYSALITAGRQDRTPLGAFFIQRRVDPETMDSATVGLPRGHPEYYYLPEVRFTQYFTAAGHALHGNYWVHPSRFGQFSSNGCLGLLNPDAAWFWEFATVGTPVFIHF